MKKVIYPICFMLIMYSTVYAADLSKTNLRQQEAEKNLKEKMRSEQMLLSRHCLMLQEDKAIYDDTGESIYGKLMTIINKNGTLYTTEAQYAQKAKNLFDTLSKTTPENPITVEQFKKMTITVADSDFDKISDELKKIIFFVNTY